MNKFWTSNVQYGDSSQYYCILHLKFAKKIELKYVLTTKTKHDNYVLDMFEMMNMLSSLIVVIISQCIIPQNIKFYTLNYAIFIYQ